jgi:DNA-binding SARP family transcriptional activator
MSPSSTLRLRLLQGFELEDEYGAITVPAQGQRLIAYLALQGRSVLRSHVAGVLWTDTSEEQARASLRSALSRLRALVPTLIVCDARSVRLNPGVELDVTTALEAVAPLEPGEPLDAERRALLLGSGDILPDSYEDWVIVERELFRQLRLHALEDLCHRLREAGRFADAAVAGLAAVAAEPLRESAHRAVARLYLEEGNPNEAVRQFELYRDLVQRDLGLRPSAEFVELVFDGAAQLESGHGRSR